MIGRCPYGQSERIFEEMFAIETDDCVLWPYATKGGGYACAKIGKDSVYLHLIALERESGPRPPGTQAAHSCGNAACINRRHLRWATQAENEADKVLHGRDNRGERHYKAKLTAADVRAIRASADSECDIDLARRFGVTAWAIREVQAGRNWRHVQEPS